MLAFPPVIAGASRANTKGKMLRHILKDYPTNAQVRYLDSLALSLGHRSGIAYFRELQREYPGIQYTRAAVAQAITIALERLKKQRSRSTESASGN